MTTFENMNDGELVQLACEGGREAFGVLFRRHRRRLYAYILQVLRHHDDAEDATQEAFIRAYRAIHGYRGEACFATWLHTIGINVARTILARRSRSLPVAASVEPEGLAEEVATGATVESAEQTYICKQMAEKVSHALAHMTPGQQRAIVLHEDDGLSYQEIAEVMDCPIGTVRSRLSDARGLIALSLGIEHQAVRRRTWHAAKQV